MLRYMAAPWVIPDEWLNNEKYAARGERQLKNRIKQIILNELDPQNRQNSKTPKTTPNNFTPNDINEISGLIATKAREIVLSAHKLNNPNFGRVPRSAAQKARLRQITNSENNFLKKLYHRRNLWNTNSRNTKRRPNNRAKTGVVEFIPWPLLGKGGNILPVNDIKGVKNIKYSQQWKSNGNYMNTFPHVMTTSRWLNIHIAQFCKKAETKPESSEFKHFRCGHKSQKTAIYLNGENKTKMTIKKSNIRGIPISTLAPKLKSFLQRGNDQGNANALKILAAKRLGDYGTIFTAKQINDANKNKNKNQLQQFLIRPGATFSDELKALLREGQNVDVFGKFLDVLVNESDKLSYFTSAIVFTLDRPAVLRCIMENVPCIFVNYDAKKWYYYYSLNGGGNSNDQERKNHNNAFVTYIKQNDQDYPYLNQLLEYKPDTHSSIVSFIDSFHDFTGSENSLPSSSTRRLAKLANDTTGTTYFTGWGQSTVTNVEKEIKKYITANFQKFGGSFPFKAMKHQLGEDRMWERTAILYDAGRFKPDPREESGWYERIAFTPARINDPATAPLSYAVVGPENNVRPGSMGIPSSIGASARLNQISKNKYNRKQVFRPETENIENGNTTANKLTGM